MMRVAGRTGVIERDMERRPDRTLKPVEGTGCQPLVPKRLLSGYALRATRLCESSIFTRCAKDCPMTMSKLKQGRCLLWQTHRGRIRYVALCDSHRIASS